MFYLFNLDSKSMICGSFLASSSYSPTGIAVILVDQGERQKEEVYSLIPSLIHRIDRACESYSPQPFISLL